MLDMFTEHGFRGGLKKVVFVCVGWGGARRRAGAAAMTLRNMCPTIILVPVVVLTSRAPWRRATHRGALCIVWSAVRPAHIILGLCAGTVRRARPGAACRAATNRGLVRFGRVDDIVPPNTEQYYWQYLAVRFLPATG